jgi:hypothetical protein
VAVSDEAQPVTARAWRLAGRFYVPTDVDAQHEAWGASCGPAALAALLACQVADLRRLFPRPWTTPTDMRHALSLCDVRWDSTPRDLEGHWPEPHAMPTHGLAFIQWDGPWLKPGVPQRAAYLYTHWIAVDHGAVYDVNANGWLPRLAWDTKLAPALAGDVERGTGLWYVRAGLELVS